MNITRSLCGFLASMILLGALASCAETSDHPGSTDAVSDTAVAGSEGNATEPAETEITDHLPDDLDFGDDEIVIISRHVEGWTSGEISVERLTGDEVNDAVYERNQAVEERLHVRIQSIFEDSTDSNVIVNTVSLAVKSGTHEYDIMAGPTNSTMSEILKNTFTDLSRLQYLDLEQPWWSQGFNDMAEYGGSRYAVTGSAVLALYRFAFATVFNKNLFTDAEQPFLYEDVKNGTWTLDRQIELTSVFHRDNGNGVQDLEGDVYGFTTSKHVSVDPYWSACRVDVIRKNVEGDYEVVFDVSHLHDVTEKLLRLYYGSDASYIFANESADGEQIKMRDMFADGSVAMVTLRLLELESGSIRNMKDQFGVVPMPKYDEAQDDYYTLLHNQFTVFCIPTTIQETRMDEMGAFLEAMSVEGYRTVKPAYYESTLRTKLVQDPASAEMLDLIVENVHIDIGILYAAYFDSFHDTFRGIISSKTNKVASTYKSLAQRLEQRSLPKLIAKLEALSAGN